MVVMVAKAVVQKFFCSSIHFQVKSTDDCNAGEGAMTGQYTDDDHLQYQRLIGIVTKISYTFISKSSQ